jgi:hypothetical protein
MSKRPAKIEKRFYLTFKQQLVWMISTAFAIAAALMWKDAITLVINNYISITGEIQYSIYAASIVTIIGIWIIWLLNEVFKK